MIKKTAFERTNKSLVSASMLVISGPILAVEWITRSEINGDFFHSCPAYPFVTIDIFNQAFQHKQHLRATTHVRVDCYWKDPVIKLTIYPIKLIAPKFFDITRVYKPMAVRRSFDEHHWRQIIHIPVCTNFYQIYFIAMNERFHPLFGLLGKIDLGPFVTRAGIHRYKVLIALAMVILEPMFEQEIDSCLRHFPPRCYIPARALTGNFLYQLNRFDEHSLLLRCCHCNRVFMRI